MRRKKLLVVDDARLFLHLSKTMLSGGDFFVHTATNGPEALDIARENKPDLILLDLYMPEMDGDEICRKIRLDPVTRHIPVIMITTDSDGKGRRRCLYSGCDDFITKPMRAETLKKIINRHLGPKDRTYPRAGVTLPCLLDSGQKIYKTNIYTLSAGGAYVEIDPPPLPGTTHRLVFSLPGEQENLSVRALARWNRLVRIERPVGSGFEFVEMDEQNLERLSDWVDSTLENPVFT